MKWTFAKLIQGHISKAVAAVMLTAAVILTVSNAPYALAGAGDATGTPLIKGNPVVGQVLTADTFLINDPDGITDVTFSYQWVRVDTDDTESNISGATDSTYRLKSADSGKTIKVVVSFTDAAGNAESLTSAAFPETDTITTPEGPYPISATTVGLGTFINIRFNENLGTGSSAPPKSALHINLNGHAVVAEHLSIVSGRTLTLGQFKPVVEPVPTGGVVVIRNTDTITASYTDPSAADDTAALQDSSGNDALSFTDFPVTNADTTVVPGAPEPVWDFKAVADGTDTIVLSWKPGWQNGSRTTGYSIQWAPDWDGNISQAANANWVPLVVGLAPDLTSYVHTGLEPGTALHYRIRGRAGRLTTPWTYSTFTETEDYTGPEVEEITVPVNGDEVHVRFNELLSDVVPGPEAFTLKVRNITRSISAVSRSTDLPETEEVEEQDQIILTLDDYLIRQGEPVTVSYTDPTDGNDTNAVQDEHGNDATSFNDVPATANLSSVAPKAPTKPTGLSALRDEHDSTKVKLSWTAPSMSEGRDITGYVVQYRTQDVLWTDATSNTGNDDTTYTHENPPSDAIIKYRVSAINLVANSPFSNEARTDAMVAAGPVLSATAVSLDEILLSWTVPDDGGAGITGYKIEVSNSGVGNWRTLVADTNSLDTTYTVTGVKVTHTRYYRVTAINAIGLGAASNVTRLLGLPRLGSDEVVAWESLITVGNIANLTGYVAGQGTNSTPSFTYSGKTFEIQNINTATLPSKQHMIFHFEDEHSNSQRNIFATSSFTLQVGMSEFDMGESQLLSGSAYVWTDDVEVNWEEGDVAAVRLLRTKSAPEPPTDLTATTTLQGQINLTWNAPEDNGGNTITGYRVERSPNGTTNWAVLEQDTGETDTSYNDTTVPPATTRYYRVSAINSQGPSAPSANAEGSTPAGQALPTLGSDEVVIWQSQITVGNIANLTGYVAGQGTNSTPSFTYSGKTFEIQNINTATLPSKQHMIFHFEDEHSNSQRNIFATSSFTLQVGMSEFDMGESQLLSGSAYVWTDDVDIDWQVGDIMAVRLIRKNTAPEPPTGLTASTNLNGKIDLTWTAPEDHGGTDITGYRVEVATDSAGNDRTVLEESTTSTSYSHTGLPAGATRHYWVSAINETGTSERSESAQGMTSGTATGPVFQNAVMDTTGQVIVLTFNKDLDETAANAPPTTAFTVKGDGTSYAISTVAISGTKVTLTLTAPLSGVDKVTVGYMDPTSGDDDNAVQDTLRNDAGTFSNQLVTRPGLTLTTDTKSIPLAHTDPDGKTTFTITRGGDTTNDLTVPVAITQDQDWLSSSRLSQSITIPAGQTSADLELTHEWFWEDNEDDIPGGELTATLGTVAGYNTTGQSETIYIHGRTQVTGTVTMDTPEYRFPEDSGDNTVYAVVTLETGVTPEKLADLTIRVNTVTHTAPGEARSDGDQDHKSIPEKFITFRADDYVIRSGNYVARKPFTITIYDDDFPEPDEYFRVPLNEGNTDYPHRAFPRCVGTDCVNNPLADDPYALVIIISDDLGAPGDLTATATSASQISLSWNAPTILGLSNITGYRVEIAESATSQNWAVAEADTGSTATTYSHTGLPPSATRYFRVSAIDDAGPGVASGTAHATTTGSSDGPIFTNAHLIASRQGLDVYFDEAIEDDSSKIPAASTFTVKVNGATVAIESISIASTDKATIATTSAIAENATVTVSYTDPTTSDDDNAIQDSSGNDAPSFSDQPVAEPPTHTGVPGRPTGLQATFDGAELEMTLTWTAPTAMGGSDISGYRVQRSTDNNNWQTLRSSHNKLTFLDQTVIHGRTYYYRVAAINDDGRGPDSEVLTVVDETPPPLAHATATTEGDQVRLAFKEALDTTIDVTGLLDSYSITANGVDLTSGPGRAIEFGTHDATFSVSTGEKIYKGETVVVSYTDPTAGDDANALQDRAGNDVPTITNLVARFNNSRQVREPFEPTGLSATGGENKISLTWTAPKRDGGSPITGYKIERSADGGTTWTTIVADTESDGTNHEESGIPVSTTRHYRVSAISAEGTSDPSGTANATTSATGDDDGPTLVSAELKASGTSTVLTFNEALEDASGKTAPVTQFTLSADGTNATLSSAATDGQAKQVTLTHSSINEDATVTVSYTDPTTSNDAAALQDILGNDADTFTNQDVTNNSTIAGPLEPCDPTETGQLWCATLTVGDTTNSDSEAVLGYNETDSLGSLSPGAFVRSTAIVGVEQLQYTDVTGGNLEFEVELDSGTTPAEGLLGVNSLGLHIDEQTFSITTPGTARSFTFTGHGLNWYDGREVRVRLTEIHSKPDAPTNLTAAAKGPAIIELSWNAPLNNGGAEITGYKVEWSADGSTNWQTLAASHKGTSYRDTGLSAGTTRHYRVSAINSVGTSDASNTDNATTQALTSCDATDEDELWCATLTVKEFSLDDIAHLGFIHSPRQGSLSPRTFQRDTATAGVLSLFHDATTLTFTINTHSGTAPADGLLGTGDFALQLDDDTFSIADPGTDTSFEFTGHSLAWTDGQSVRVKLLFVPAKPDPPTSLSATAKGSTIIGLSWTAPEDDGGAAITGYKIEWSADGNDPWTVLAANHDGTTYSDTGLTQGTTRHYRVSAINRVGTGDPSNTDSATTGTLEACDTTDQNELWCAALTVKEFTSGANTFRGYQHSPSQGSIAPDNFTYRTATITARNLWYNTASGTLTFEIERTSGTTPTDGLLGSRDFTLKLGDETVSLSSPGTTTTLSVAASSLSWTDADTVRVKLLLVPIEPDAPTNLTASARGTSIIDLSWTEPENNGGAEITGYKVEWSADGSTNWQTLAASHTETSYSDTGLATGTTRYYRVSAINSVGTGDASQTANATTGTLAACDTTNQYEIWCAALTVKEFTSGANTFRGYQHSPSQGSVSPDNFTYRTATITVRNLSYNTTSGTLTFEIERTAGTTPTDGLLGTRDFDLKLGSQTITLTSPGTTTTFSVTNSGLSWNDGDTVRIRLLMVPAKPGAPTDLSATANGDTQIDLSWTAPEDDGGSAITGYKVEWSADGNDPWNTLVASHAGTAYSHTGLTATTTRHYRVSAINSVGAGEPSITASATTEEADTTGPAFSSAQVPSSGTHLYLTMSETLDLGSSGLPPASAFTVTADGTTVIVTEVQTRPGVTNGVSLRLARAIYIEETALVGYTDPTAGNDTAALQDDDGNDAPSFQNRTVTNSSTQNGPPAKVNGLQVTADDGSLHVSWNAAARADQYKVEWKSGSQGYSSSRRQTVTGTSTTIIGLTNDTQYTVRVTGSNSLGDGTPSDEQQGTPRYVLPNQVTGVTVKAGYGEIKVSWDQLTDARSYRVQYKSGTQDYDETWPRLQTVPGETRTVRGLEHATRYTFRVRAILPDRTLGPWSTEHSATTDEPLRLPEPTTVVVQEDGEYIVVTFPSRIRLMFPEPRAQDFTLEADGTTIPLSQANPCWTRERTGEECDTTWGNSDGYTAQKLLLHLASHHDGPQVTRYRVGQNQAVALSYSYPLGSADWTDVAATNNSTVTGYAPQVDGSGDGPALLVAVESPPVAHDGSSDHEVRIAFNEPLADGFSSDTLRDHSLTTEGATIKEVERVTETGEERNKRWKITVKPSGNARMIITLHPGPSCSSENAMCGKSGGRLAESVPITIPGPNIPATGTPTITGTAQVGSTLTADVSDISDDNGIENASFEYQWVRNDGTADTNIPGATGSSYELVSADQGKTIKVRVSFTDDDNYAESLTSAATGTIAARPNRPATGAVTITGTLEVGETLTADTSGVSDEDGINTATFTYQWYAGGAQINNATSNTYTLTDDELDDAIHVWISFEDNRGNTETMTSAATAAVTDAQGSAPPPNSPAEGKPTITGTTQVGQTLTASTSSITDEDGLNDVSYSYQWLRDGADIDDATSSSYTLTDDDKGSAISVKVSFSDDLGNRESLTSDATAAVVGPPLTVSLDTVPDSHQGSGTFIFTMSFSEEPKEGFSYETLRDHAFTVTGGKVDKAGRLNAPSNIGWKITIEVDDDGDVRIQLPATTDCTTSGAVCTDDGRMLSNSLDFTVAGP